MKNKILLILKEKKGATLVNVLISFVILMILVLMFYKIIVFSQNIISRADDVRDDTAALFKGYYLSGAFDSEAVGDELNLTDGTNTIKINDKLYKYVLSDYSTILYSFGKHLTVVEAGGGN